jgi:hypothetical protein
MPEPWQGKIRSEWHIACRRCRNEDASGRPRPLAVAFFKGLGWQRRQGGWICPECVASPPPPEAQNHPSVRGASKL